MRDDIIEQPGVLDFLERVAECFGRALFRLRSGPQDSDWDDLTARSRAGNFHDYLMAELKMEFNDDEDVTYKENNQLRTLVTPFAELRAKKANSRFKTVAHNSTRRSRVWIQLVLDEQLAPLDKLFLGYSVGKGWNTLQDMALMEFEGKIATDVIIIPFEDQKPMKSPVAPIGFVAPLRLNVAGIRRERQAQMLRTEESEHEESGS